MSLSPLWFPPLNIRILFVLYYFIYIILFVLFLFQSCCLILIILLLSVFAGGINKTNIHPKEYPAFQKFNRTFTWNLRSDDVMSFYFNFTWMGLHQIQQTDSCPDKHIYTFTSMKGIVGSFCQKGNIKKVGVRNPGQLSLNVAGGQLLDEKVIIASVGNRMICKWSFLPSSCRCYLFCKLLNVHFFTALAHIVVNFQMKNSKLEVFSPNHPNDFPSKAETLWSFIVPPSYYASVFLLNYTLPTCLKPNSIPAIVYTWIEKRFQIMKLDDIQPSLEPGYFDLSLRNCETFQQHPSQKGLTVHIQISITKRKKGMEMFLL